MLRVLLLSGLASAAAGCAFGPRALERAHGRYNAAYQRVDCEEVLLNVVRLRYGDPPAEVEVSGIAAQYERAASAEGRPFFAAPNPAGATFRTFAAVLPFAAAGGSDNPTVTLTPVHGGETVARYFRPITPEALLVFAEAGWPVGALLRIWADGVNGVPNAPAAVDPARPCPPGAADFRRATDLLQGFQDRGELAVRLVEEDVPGDPIGLDRVSGEALVEARKAGCEYRLTPDRTGWQLVTRARHLYLDLSPRAVGGPEYAELCRLLNLRPGATRFEVTRSTVGFPEQAPGAAPADRLALAPRSLIQAVFYLSRGVEVPAEHLASGVATAAADCGDVTNGLFTVRACGGKRPPAGAAVAVRYRGYWFYVDDTDHVTKSTLMLLRPARELDLGRPPADRRSPAGPVLTLPVGR